MIKLSKRNSLLLRCLALLYNTLLVYALMTAWLLYTQFSQYPWATIIIIAPLGIHYTLALISTFGRLFFAHFLAQLDQMNRFLGWYSGLVITFLFVILSTGVSNTLEFAYTVSLLPLVLFHWQAFISYWYRQFSLYTKVFIRLATRRKHPKKSAKATKLEQPDISVTQAESDVPVLTPMPEVSSLIKDIDRRQFLKLLGGTSIGIAAMSLIMPQKANAAFFGSVPGPGVVSLKDSSGNKIDPKEKSPTDGYNITEIDDNALPSYYGFVNKDGAWYISKEDSTGSYRYTKGSSNFALSWTGRALLSYDYFDAVFA